MSDIPSEAGLEARSAEGPENLWRKFWRFVFKFVKTSVFRYGVLSGVSFSINYGTTCGLHELAGVNEVTSYLLGLIFASTTNFFGLRYWVFNDGRSQPLLEQAIQFASTIATFRLGEFVTYVLLVRVFDWYYQLAWFVITCTALVLKFVACSKWIFAKRPQKKEN